MAASFRPKLGMGLQQIAMGTPPIWGGPATEEDPQLPQARMQPEASPQKGGFFADGGMGRILAGAIGDGLLQNAGMAPVYAPMQRQKQQSAQEEAQWTRRREAQRADQQWEWANKPKDPIIRETNAGNIIRLDPVTGQSTTLFTDPTPKINYQRVNNPDGTFTMVPMPMGGAPAASGAPTAPVGKLTPMGGGASNGVGGFPGTR